MANTFSDPPEAPTIQGYMDGETVRMGQAVTLVCESHGGNPLARVIWYKNDKRIDQSDTSSGSVARNTIMFLAQPDDNDAEYRCEASNKMTHQPLSSKIVMAVQCKRYYQLSLKILMKILQLLLTKLT